MIYREVMNLAAGVGGCVFADINASVVLRQ